MLFQTPQFLILMLAVLLGAALIRTRTLQLTMLLAASYVFYMSWNPMFIVLILFTTLTNYIAGRGIATARRRGARVAWVALTCSINLGLLAVYKYCDFFIDSFNTVMAWAGSETTVRFLRLSLPVGISFYTFQSLGYVVDVFRDPGRVEKSLPRFALFVSFFPTLLSGPILRSTHFLPQLDERRSLDSHRIRSGVHLFLVGLVKKVIFADQLTSLTDAVFNSPQGLPSLAIWIGALAFGIRIYCDFSGYTDMARGVARMIGFDIPLNFNYPYAAKSIADFWRRWHISLSTWLRDYLYIPLGGSRRGVPNTYRNLMITMVLGGLWHGAGWGFVIWGSYQGALLCVERILGWPRRRDAGDAPAKSMLLSKAGRVVGWAVVQYLVFLGWVFFRVRGLENIVYCFRKYVLFDFKGVSSGLGLGSANPFTALGLIAGFIVLHLASYRMGSIAGRLDRMSWPLRSLVYLIAFVCMFALWPTQRTAFIYFQF